MKKISPVCWQLTILRPAFYFILLFLAGCCPVTPHVLEELEAPVNQAIVVHPLNKNSTQATLSTWQRKGFIWRRLLLISAVIGKNGLSLVGQKKEGDGKTPQGVYPLGPAFGYAPAINTGLSYRQAGPNDFWVDDKNSRQYNQWVSGMPDAKSFERMRRPDGLYQYGIVIGYNRNPVIPGAGSAIFMHVWRRYNSPTSGCVAVNQRYLRKILRWLNQKDQPVIFLQ
ncbi:MAG: L,D-transpeptidase family protein [Candidatus Omnitrophica bacterium]|nr:L,D-transpeptidase family protein [Candidatus Omnitrophota bacterium]